MVNMSDVAIIGAGPYGLSVAAHLKSRGVNFRIFGRPMSTWKENMPQGMFLKSLGFASNLSDPGSKFTLMDFCAERGIPYDHTGIPVHVNTFSEYGVAFQKRMVPSLEERTIVALKPVSGGFQLRADDGEIILASRVLVAAGISHFDYVPPVLTHLPPELQSHCSAHRRVDRFRGRSVVVIGSGASATDLAAELFESGADVKIYCRRPIKYHSRPGMSAPRSWWQEFRHPLTGIGMGWRSRFVTDGPHLFRLLPEKFRLRVVKNYLGPSSGWFIKDKIVGHVPVMEGHSLQAAEATEGRVRLTFTDASGQKKEETADHVIAATGYRVSVDRLSFLDDQIRSSMKTVEKSPILSTNFESSIPGLYFIGVASANSFGPVMRFAFGAAYTARRISRHLASV